MDAKVAERTRQEIIRLCHTGLDSRALRQGTMRQLRKVTPIDAFWYATVDPATTGQPIDYEAPLPDR